MLKLGLTAAQIAMKAKKLPLSKLKKMFKEHFGIDDAGLSKDQIATKLASAGQKSVKQSKNVVGAKKFLQGSGLTALGLGPFIFDSKDKSQASPKETPRKKPASEATKKKKPSIPTEKPTPRPKKKMFMKERSGKDSDVEFGTGKAKTKLSTGGATGLKKIRADQPGLKALKKKAPQVVRNMGYLRKGSLVTKKKTKGGSKGGKGILVVSIGVGKMAKKKPTTKKKTTKKTKRG
mgnify:FL=1|tara:strand:+ start:42 stop:743 length:702 start_codon:yes stop_codon:yes gene_type:complete